LTSCSPYGGILLVTKRKVKEELKRPDILLAAIGYVVGWVKEHVRVCVIGAVALVAIALAVTGYKIYQANEDEKLQYQLTEGIRSFQEYAMNGSDEALRHALKEWMISRSSTWARSIIPAERPRTPRPYISMLRTRAPTAP
jgi:hypothetical protein